MRLIIPLFLVILLSNCQYTSPNSVSSPDRSIQLSIDETDGALYMTATYHDDTIFYNSLIGLKFEEDQDPDKLEICHFEKRIKDSKWTTINGKNKVVQDHFEELNLELIKQSDNSLLYHIIIRCYNDGFAYRYHFPEANPDGKISFDSEITELNFANDVTWWSYNGENHNIGPEKLSKSAERIIRTPMVSRISDSCYLAVHEAEIIRNAPLALQVSTSGSSLQYQLTPTVESAPYSTSWRSFILGKKPGSLVESNLLVNLNEECQIKNPEWIKPGKAMWDWRVWGYKADDGFEYGLNTVSHKRFIDFASKNNIQYLLIDADWYGSEFSEESDPTSSREGVDIVECMRHAKEKNVGVILYLNDVGAKKFGLERVLKQFAEWGAVGVKYGFMRGNPEQKVQHTREVVELCAQYKLMVNFHDNPVPPSGDRRTWPNLMTKEFGHSQADAKKSYYPETAVTAPFINLIAGPLDMCEGWFGFNEAESRVKVFEEIPGTVAAEVAKLIVNYSGWKILPDSPEEYLKKEDLFDCIRQMPPQFDSYKVLDGQIGEFLSVARESGNDWFIGSLTNRESRHINMSFNFLEKGAKYEATLYEDASSTHFMNEKESYQIRTMLIDSDSSIELKLAEGGGHSIWLKRI